MEVSKFKIENEVVNIKDSTARNGVETNANAISSLSTNLSTLSTNVGNLENLETIDKTDVVGAINEVNTNSIANTNSIGDLTELITEEKSTLVGAINEIADVVVSDILNKVFPVGSVYSSFNNVSPEEFIGGTWQAIEDGLLLKSTTSDSGVTSGSNTVELEADNIPTLTTGNESATHTHSVTVTGGNHNHTIVSNIAGGGGTFVNEIVGGASNNINTSDSGNLTMSGTTNANGTSHTHTYSNDDVQSFSIENRNITVYMWQRIS